MLRLYVLTCDTVCHIEWRSQHWIQMFLQEPKQLES